jgi:protein import protein ZIM17
VKADGDKMVIMFTCTVCDTRSARKISKRAYAEGIVLVRCGGCKNRHLIADRMGVFEDTIADKDGSLQPGTGWDIQKYLAKEMGTTSKYITDENVFELTVQDILGAKAAAMHEGAEPIVPRDPSDARI